MKILNVLFYSVINFCVLAYNNVAHSVDTVAKGLSDIPTPANINQFEEILNVLLSLIGGILSTVVITILKSKFPKLFAKSKFNKKVD